MAMSFEKLKNKVMADREAGAKARLQNGDNGIHRDSTIAGAPPEAGTKTNGSGGLDINKLAAKVKADREAKAANREKEKAKKEEAALRGEIIRQTEANLGAALQPSLRPKSILGGAGAKARFQNGGNAASAPRTSGGAPLVSPAVEKELADFRQKTVLAEEKADAGQWTEEDAKDYRDGFVKANATANAYAALSAAADAEKAYREEEERRIKAAMRYDVGGTHSFQTVPAKETSEFAKNLPHKERMGQSVMQKVGKSDELAALKVQRDNAAHERDKANRAYNAAYDAYTKTPSEQTKKNYTAALVAWREADDKYNQLNADVTAMNEQINVMKVYAIQDGYFDRYKKTDGVSDERLREFERSIRKKSAYGSGTSGGGANGYSADANRLFLYGDALQKKVFISLLETEGKKVAEEFAGEIAPLIGIRMQDAYSENYKQYGFLDKAAVGLTTHAAAGISDYVQGLKGAGKALTGNDSYTFPTAMQSVAQGVRRAENGFAAGAAMDVIRSAANMAPSLALGAVTAGAGAPAAGAALQSISFGGSAGGNGYIQAINDGFGHREALAYGAVTGASEVILERILGGIAGFGASGASRFASTSAGKATTGRLRGLLSRESVKASPRLHTAFSVLGHAVGNMSSEAVEEAAQELLDPIFRYLILGDKDAKITAQTFKDALYAGLLGALTAGFMNVPGDVSRASSLDRVLHGTATEADVYDVLADGDARAFFEKATGFSLPEDVSAAALALFSYTAGAKADFARALTVPDGSAELFKGKNAMGIIEVFDEELNAAGVDAPAFTFEEALSSPGNANEGGGVNGNELKVRLEHGNLPGKIRTEYEKARAEIADAAEQARLSLDETFRQIAAESKESASLGRIAKSRAELERFLDANSGGEIYVNGEKRVLKGGSRNAIQTVGADGVVVTDSLIGGDIHYTARGFVYTAKNGTQRVYRFGDGVIRVNGAGENGVDKARDGQKNNVSDEMRGALIQSHEGTKAETNGAKTSIQGIFDKTVGTPANLATPEQVDSFIDYAIEYAVQTKEKGNKEFPKQREAILYAAVDNRTVEDLKGEIGLSGMYHALNDNDLRHILNSHGEKTNEKYPVTANDLKQIPDIVKNYDDVLYVPHSGGKGGIYYVKQHNGVTYYLEAVNDDGTLQNKQMIKVDTGTIPDIKGLKNAINKKWNTSPLQMNQIPRMYVHDVRKSVLTNSISAKNERNSFESVNKSDKVTEADGKVENSTDGVEKNAVLTGNEAETFFVGEDGKIRFRQSYESYSSDGKRKAATYDILVFPGKTKAVNGTVIGEYGVHKQEENGKWSLDSIQNGLSLSLFDTKKEALQCADYFAKNIPHLDFTYTRLISGSIRMVRDKLNAEQRQNFDRIVQILKDKTYLAYKSTDEHTFPFQNRQMLYDYLRTGVGKPVWVNGKERVLGKVTDGRFETILPDGSVSRADLRGTNVAYTSNGFDVTYKNGTVVKYSFTVGEGTHEVSVDKAAEDWYNESGTSGKETVGDDKGRNDSEVKAGVLRGVSGVSGTSDAGAVRGVRESTGDSGGNDGLFEHSQRPAVTGVRSEHDAGTVKSLFGHSGKTHGRLFSQTWDYLKRQRIEGTFTHEPYNPNHKSDYRAATTDAKSFIDKAGELGFGLMEYNSGMIAYHPAAEDAVPHSLLTWQDHVQKAGVTVIFSDEPIPTFNDGIVEYHDAFYVPSLKRIFYNFNAEPDGFDVKNHEFFHYVFHSFPEISDDFTDTLFSHMKEDYRHSMSDALRKI